MAERDPFLRPQYRAHEFGTIVVDGLIVPFDVLSKDDSDRLLGEDTVVGRVDGKIVVSERVPDRPSSMHQIEESLLNLGRIGAMSKTPLKTDIIREFLEVEEELRKSSSPQLYEGPCI
ncbi:hypothetical protein HZB74_01425 [Candidatus Saccharibacteria bacterium]|nr:hypothetical protein [Candidatus Saccharibacteria bacterium]